MTPNEYRQKHRCCATCEYYRNSYCEVKQKGKRCFSGKFCKVYNPLKFEKKHKYHFVSLND